MTTKENVCHHSVCRITLKCQWLTENVDVKKLNLWQDRCFIKFYNRLPYNRFADLSCLAGDNRKQKRGRISLEMNGEIAQARTRSTHSGGDGLKMASAKKCCIYLMGKGSKMDNKVAWRDDILFLNVLKCRIIDNKILSHLYELNVRAIWQQSFWIKLKSII